MLISRSAAVKPFVHKLAARRLRAGSIIIHISPLRFISHNAVRTNYPLVRSPALRLSDPQSAGIFSICFLEQYIKSVRILIVFSAKSAPSQLQTKNPPKRIFCLLYSYPRVSFGEFFVYFNSYRRIFSTNFFFQRFVIVQSDRSRREACSSETSFQTSFVYKLHKLVRAPSVFDPAPDAAR